ncbi:MAG TPA: RHS repeat-associated core domain-containing protein [Candidatus Limnocylindrales bacterium]
MSNGMPGRAGRRLTTAVAIVGLIAGACGSSPSPSQPAPAPTNPAAAPSPSASVGHGPVAIDECDPAGLIGCDQQAAFLSIPIVDTGLALTWSSQWAAGRTDRAGWDAGGLGLGGWSLNVVDRYRAADRALIAGDGTWRFVDPVPAASGESAVPSFDGSLADVLDAAGRHVRTVDGFLGLPLLTIAYDASGRLSSVGGTVRGLPVHLEVRRASDGTPQSLAGIDGALTTLALDADGHLAAATDPGGSTTSLHWAPGGLVTSETDALGGVTRFTYDQDGRLVASSDADGVTVQRARSETTDGVEIRATTALGRTTTCQVQSIAGGIRRILTAPDGTATVETIGADGSRTLATPDGTKRTIGALASTGWGMAAPLLTPDVTRRPDGVTSTTTIAQQLSQVGDVPDALSGTVTTTRNGDATVRAFDPSARTVATVDPAGRRTLLTFDPNGRMVADAAAGQPTIAATYDAAGRQATSTVGTGASARTTRFTYDPSTGIETATRPDGTTLTVGVDAQGNAVTSTAADGSTAVTTFGALGRPVVEQPAGGLGYTLGYSPAGRPTGFLPPSVPGDASAATTTYDADGLTSMVSGPGTTAMAVTYDAAGHVTGWTGSTGQSTLAWDAKTGQESSASDPDGIRVAYGHTSGQADGLTWSGPLSGSVSVTLDANGRMTDELVNGQPGFGFGYDAAGSLTRISELGIVRDTSTGRVTSSSVGPITTDQAFDANGELIRSTTSVGPTPGPAGRHAIIDDRSSFDALGRIAKVVETAGGRTTTTTYTYDAADRLASVSVDGRTVERDAYDASGNRTQVTGSSGTTHAAYDARNELTSWGTASYRLAPDGSLASVTSPSGTTTFLFDELGRLRSATLPDGRAVTYVVDADGRRVGREVGGHLVAGYLYDPAGHVVAETDGSSAVTEWFAYDDLGHLALMQRGDTSYRVITDAVGSPRLVISAADGAVADAIDYDAWGRITHETHPGFIPFGFGGGLVDPDTGFVHFGARDYDPVTGRWTSQDPIRFAGGDANLYRYASGDPVNLTDPTGLYPWTCSGIYCEGQKNPNTGVPTVCALASCGNGTTSFNCIGLWCHGTTGSGCLFGSCSNNNTGFTCNALYCRQPGGGGCVWCTLGDPHLLSAGSHFDFQAAGEFLTARSPDGSLEIQARQEPVLGGTVVTFTTALAANVDGDRIGIYADEPSLLMVNGRSSNASDLAMELPHGGGLEHHGSLVTVTWADGSRMVVTRRGKALDYSLTPSTAIQPTLRGLLANAGQGPASALSGRDGQVLKVADPNFHEKLYGQFGNSWRISQSESLFDYGPGESTATFQKPDIPSAEATVASLSPDVRAKAGATCQAFGVRSEPLLDDCTLDVGMTGDASYAADTAAVAAAGAGGAKTTSTPANVTPISIGQTVTGSIASPTQTDDYTFTGTKDEAVYLQSKATCSGSLQWELLGPDGVPLDGSVVCTDLLRQLLSAEGTYTVRVNADRNAMGAYGFSLLAVPATVVTPISLGQGVNGSLAAAGQWADYTFDGSAHQVVYVQRVGDCTSHLLWTLLGPAGTRIGDTQTCNDLGRMELPAAGTYTVRIHGDRGTTGAYAFQVLSVPATTTTSISVGQPVAGSVNGIGQEALYTFDAVAGSTITVHATGACVDGLVWELLRPDGQPVAGTAACHDLSSVASQGGTYTIHVHGNQAATGAYAFTLQGGG